MNINDFPEEFTQEHIPKMFELIFKRQKELSEKYGPIEYKNGLRWTLDVPVQINSGKGQSQLKDFAWRVVEEIGEALEAAYFHDKAIDNQDDKFTEFLIHSKEEFADGLHFLVELLILSGIDHDNLLSKEQFFAETEAHSPFIQKLLITEDLYAVTGIFIKQLGIAMNNLKMKPWKNTHYNTDITKYKSDLEAVFWDYLFLLSLIMTPLEILNFYFRKSEVNKFRIKSNY